LALPENQQAEAARLTVAKGFSVRQTESLVRSLLAAQDAPQPEKRVDPNVAQLQQSLIDKLGAAVQIDYNKKGQGKLIIRYNSFEELDGISAFIKSMRGSQPDATLHYLARMIKAGEDPVFIARRMVIFASEDIGNAQPTALVLATACMQAVHMIGMPEASLILAQTATYLASAKKSIASTEGIYAALSDIDENALEAIPLHLRNPSNKVMKNIGYGKGHTRYPWQVEKETGQKVKQEYMPKNLVGKKYYKEDWK
jgi:putative ATPase